MAKLTPKQEKFCQEYVITGNKSQAYRLSYSASKMKSETINVKANELSNVGKVSVRIKELKEELRLKNVYTLEKSVKRDISLIERYEAALDVLENNESKGIDVEVAERLIKFIGSQGYNSAQERLSKQHGFFEKDNNQKKIPDRVIVDLSDYKGEK
ncbi:terminase small subunit [Polaribacter phage Danklef_1]|uniref:Terminase small subunit n=1 Tax=Polaribacter phage Danklef_1 TaxID=2745646 RepID=A0A8E4ZLV5_9CAUD|nr:terminase small subunit [Polaribacter phage Danklef_1]QQV90636.1 terminase small subunit [Polaribacter phage Danklef_2]QQV90713.1 terminase small subunit [Polaribacter phage Danklef_3]QQV90790.1 terminase small subunit [Polaribacter phage Danklef_4]QQV90868.1 terminase small subunit [Polaribacter phage Danklef_5]QQV90560.1 terminase small subunit [Polaribacter phage Danklef_1]